MMDAVTEHRPAFKYIHNRQCCAKVLISKKKVIKFFWHICLMSTNNIVFFFVVVTIPCHPSAPTKENLVEPHLSINQHQSTYRSASISINQHQSASISIDQRFNQHINQLQSSSVSVVTLSQKTVLSQNQRLDLQLYVQSQNDRFNLKIKMALIIYTTFEPKVPVN